MARYDEAGAETDHPQFPFMLTFVPNKELGKVTLQKIKINNQNMRLNIENN